MAICFASLIPLWIYTLTQIITNFVKPKTIRNNISGKQLCWKTISIFLSAVVIGYLSLFSRLLQPVFHTKFLCWTKNNKNIKYYKHYCFQLAKNSSWKTDCVFLSKGNALQDICKSSKRNVKNISLQSWSLGKLEPRMSIYCNTNNFR